MAKKLTSKYVPMKKQKKIKSKSAPKLNPFKKAMGGY